MTLRFSSAPLTLSLRVLMGAVMVLLAPQAWATTVIDQIDVVSSRYGTELKLHADQPIQHRVVQASDTDMTIELSNVSPARHLRTNFAQAGQVHHVIVQPIGGNALKVVLRGQQLGQPLVQVVYTQPTALTNPQSRPLPLVTQPLSSPSMAMPPATSPQPLAASPKATSTLATPSAAPTSTIASLPPVREVSSEPLFLSDSDALNPVTPSTPAPPQGLMGLLANHWLYALVAGSLLLATIAGLGLFIWKKWQELQHQAPHQAALFKALSAEEWPANDRSLEESDPDSFFGTGHHAKKANPWAQRPKVAIQQPAQGVARQANQAIPSRNHRAPSQGSPQRSPQPSPAEALLASREQAPALQTPLKNRSSQGMTSPAGAVQQYARLSNTANSLSGSAPAARTQTSRTRPVQPSTRPMGNANDPLPSNPQVLDFLKDVASYMEQDGERGKARRITRNLRHYE